MFKWNLTKYTFQNIDFFLAHHGHDHSHCVSTEPGQGLTRHLLDGGGEEEDGDQDHDHADGEHGDVQAGDDVPVPDAANIQWRGAQVPAMRKS